MIATQWWYVPELQKDFFAATVTIATTIVTASTAPFVGVGNPAAKHSPHQLSKPRDHRKQLLGLRPTVS